MPPRPSLATPSAGKFFYSGNELEALAGANNYYDAIVRHFDGMLGGRVVEVGAGIGTSAEHILRRGRPREMVLLEPAENNFPIVAERFRGEPSVRVLYGYLEQHADTLAADAVVAVNVLEHVLDDVRFLRAAHRVLSPGGRILLAVPALPSLFGSLDRAFAHHRRYTKPLLAARLAEAGFRGARLRWFNLPGVAVWFAAARLLRQRTIHPAAMQLYDRLIIPWVSALERRWEPPAGQSLIAVAEA